MRCLLKILQRNFRSSLFFGHCFSFLFLRVRGIDIEWIMNFTLLMYSVRLAVCINVMVRPTFDDKWIEL